MVNKYKYGNFLIEPVDEEKRIKYFESLEEEMIGKNELHTIQYISQRQALKQEVKRLYTDLKFEVWTIYYKNNFIGFFHIEPPTEIKAPVAENIYIFEKYRKSKAIVCVIDFVTNHLYPNINIQFEHKTNPGFEKMLIKIAPDISNISIFDMKIKKRIKKIIGD